MLGFTDRGAKVWRVCESFNLVRFVGEKEKVGERNALMLGIGND